MSGSVADAWGMTSLVWLCRVLRGAAVAGCLAWSGGWALAIDLPLTIGQRDGKEAEFDTNDYINPFDADHMRARKFPKELNTTWWTWQDIHFTLDKKDAANGVTLELIPMWSDGTGELVVDVQVYSQSHQDLVSVGKVNVSATRKGLVRLPADLLVAGRNSIRLRGESGTDKTTVAVWDQIILRATDALDGAYDAEGRAQPKP